MILRYDSNKIVTTRLDPLDDLISWIEGLRSQEYVSDLLKEKHSFTSPAETRESAKAIVNHAKYAVDFLRQGLSAPADICFLPIYYAFLNLLKVIIISKGGLSELKKQKYHGASYNPDKKSCSLLADEIEIRPKGAIPLYYQLVTGQQLVTNKVLLRMNDLYAFIRSISHELKEIHNTKLPYLPIDINVEGNDNEGFRLKASVIGKVAGKSIGLTQLKILKGFKKEPNVKRSKGRRIINATGYNNYFTKRIKGAFDDAKIRLVKDCINRYLLSIEIISGNITACTALSRKSLVLPEELPIHLVFFHMSNIVRYNPEMLEQLKDSRDWSILLALSRHGTMSFLELFWSEIQQEHIKILPSLYGV